MPLIWIQVVLIEINYIIKNYWQCSREEVIYAVFSTIYIIYIIVKATNCVVNFSFRYKVQFYLLMLEINDSRKAGETWGESRSATCHLWCFIVEIHLGRNRRQRLLSGQKKNLSPCGKRTKDRKGRETAWFQLTEM